MLSLRRREAVFFFLFPLRFVPLFFIKLAEKYAFTEFGINLAVIFVPVPQERFHTINPTNARMSKLFFFSHTICYNSEMFRSFERIGLIGLLCCV